MWLQQLHGGWTAAAAAAAFPAMPAAWFYSELSWWGLKSSLPLHAAHTHCGSHYSVKSLYQQLHVECVHVTAQPSTTSAVPAKLDEYMDGVFCQCFSFVSQALNKPQST
jgi:hypothetical protein